MTPQTLLQHFDDGRPWAAPAGDDFDNLAEAYQTALSVRALRVARGERPRGFKVGFTNRTIWPRYNVYAPIWGSVWDSSLQFCEGSAQVSLKHLCQPRLEPEAVFGFKATPPAGATLQDLFNALDWVAPGFELVQSHCPGWKFNAAQSVADGGLHGRLLVGPRVQVARLAPDADALHRRLAAAQVHLQRAGSTVETGRGANVLDSPLQALRHFVAELRACPGAPDLAAGDVVTTGTWTDAWPVAAGEQWMAQFDTVLPALAISFN